MFVVYESNYSGSGVLCIYTKKLWRQTVLESKKAWDWHQSCQAVLLEL